MYTNIIGPPLSIMGVFPPTPLQMYIVVFALLYKESQCFPCRFAAACPSSLRPVRPSSLRSLRPVRPRCGLSVLARGRSFLFWPSRTSLRSHTLSHPAAPLRGAVSRPRFARPRAALERNAAVSSLEFRKSSERVPI